MSALNVGSDFMQTAMVELARRNCSAKNPLSNNPSAHVATHNMFVLRYNRDYKQLYKEATSVDIHEGSAHPYSVWQLISLFGFARNQPYPEDEYDIPRGGNHVYVATRAPKISPTRKKTAGLGYTFGLEIETAMGHVDLSALNVSVTGDGSITGNEYVTSPLHGDSGIRDLKLITEAMTRCMLVDDTCSVHVHVGGADGADTPKFNRMFSAAALRLGQMLEGELMSMVPDCRKRLENSQGIRFLNTIQSALGNNIVDMHNAKEMVARYVFSVNRFSRDNSSRANIGRWNLARYRWLNLINCNTRNESEYRAGRDSRGFKTIEFRLWPPATDMHHIYTYVMISMAFVWFVENRQSRIWKENSLTLHDVVSEATRRNSKIKRFVLSMIGDMKARYASPSAKSKAAELKLPI
jgi:hypothetical protein